MKTKLLNHVALCTALLCTYNGVARSENEYKPDWRSLAKHTTPQWLLDSKFGLYSHWGPQSVMQENEVSQKEQGTLDDILSAIDGWKGEKFNAKTWAKMYKDAGAQFAGPIVMHGTGCVYWDSKVTDWNSTNYGPKVDILGELAKAIRSEDMKVVATFHNVIPRGIWGQRSLSDRTYVEPNIDLVSKSDDRRWMDGWYDRVIEASTKYELDLAWFDVSFGDTVGAELNGFLEEGHYDPNKPTTKSKEKSKVGGVSEAYQMKYIADYFNDAARDGREVEVIYKTNDIPVNIGMRDIENGNLTGLQYDPWMADINMQQHVNSWTWFYDEKNPLKDANTIVDMLIDITSKNGRLLLNVPPKADGSFADRVKKELKGVGDWMDINSEGIYGTIPWSIYGEGPTKVKHAGHHGHGVKGGSEMASFTGADIRYTTKGNVIYAYVLGAPENNSVKMYALGSERKLYPNEIKNITILGYKGKVNWKHESDGLVVEFPEKLPCDFAYCVKIERN